MSSVHAARPRITVVEGILEDLLAHDLPCAPRVASLLAVLLDGDPGSIREVAARLDPAERAGTRALPCPLPLTAAVADRYAALDASPEERSLLLAAALSLDDGIGPVLSTCAHSADGGDAVTAHLRVHAGRFRFVEQRLALWIQATTSDTVLAETHRRLAAAHRHRDDPAVAAWHAARASALGDPVSSIELVRAAEELADAGRGDRALIFAAEAAAHTTGAEHHAARLTAGMAAVGAGYMADAVDWLVPLFSDGIPSTRLRGLAALIVAHSHLQGAVPEVEAVRLRPQTDDREDWRHWTRAAAFGAALCAERGDRSGARAWITALREGAERTDAARRLRDPVVSLIWLLLGEGETDDADGTGPITGIVLGALRSAVAGDLEGGLRILATGEAAVVTQADPFVAGLERSDLVAAHRAVIEVLLRFWRGDVAGARARLQEASLRLPISVPFAGLGVVLARRLDLAVLGRLGSFALALTATTPAPVRGDRLVDRAIRAYLAGDANSAATCLRLWLDRGAPQSALSVPGLDECAPRLAAAPAATGNPVEPPEMTLGRLLRLRAATSADPSWRIEVEEVADAARTITSPFERARVEAALGTRALVDGDAALARSHLLAAWQLFEESGATAWSDAVADRLHRVAGEHGDSGNAESVETVRRRWGRILTPRELEVAMMAFQGGSNRHIAAALTVSVRTVEVHLGRVFTKLGVRSRIDLVLMGHRTARSV